METQLISQKSRTFKNAAVFILVTFRYLQSSVDLIRGIAGFYYCFIGRSPLMVALCKVLLEEDLGHIFRQKSRISAHFYVTRQMLEI